MNAFSHHLSFEFRTGIRNKNLLMLFYLFPLGFYLMMAVIMVGINPLFLEVLIPAMVIFAILAATMLGLPEGLVNGRETGIFRSYKINGVPAISIMAIPALTTALHLTIVAAIITITAPLLFDAPTPENWLNYYLCCCRILSESWYSNLLRDIRSPNFSHPWDYYGAVQKVGQPKLVPADHGSTWSEDHPERGPPGARTARYGIVLLRSHRIRDPVLLTLVLRGSKYVICAKKTPDVGFLNFLHPHSQAQRIEQCLCFLHIHRVPPLREPGGDFLQQSNGFRLPALPLEQVS